MTTKPLTIRQFAEHIGVSTRTVARLLAARQIKGAFKTVPDDAGHWRIPQHAVEEFTGRTANVRRRPKPKKTRRNAAA